MPQAESVQKAFVSERTLDTLEGAASRFRLKNPVISNAEIALVTETINQRTDWNGIPGCCFWWNGTLAAIRTKSDEVVIFHTFSIQKGMIAEIADQITEE